MVRIDLSSLKKHQWALSHTAANWILIACGLIYGLLLISVIPVQEIALDSLMADNAIDMRGRALLRERRGRNDLDTLLWCDDSTLRFNCRCFICRFPIRSIIQQRSSLDGIYERIWSVSGINHPTFTLMDQL